MLLPRTRGRAGALAPCLAVLAISIYWIGGLAQQSEISFGPGGQQLASEGMVSDQSGSDPDPRLHGGRSLKDGSLFWQQGEADARKLLPPAPARCRRYSMRPQAHACGCCEAACCM